MSSILTEDDEPKKKPGGTSKFSPISLVYIYRYARSGMKDVAIAAALGIDKQTFYRWKMDNPDILETLKLARESVSKLKDWQRYYYDRLPDELRKLWDRLESYADVPNSVDKIEDMLMSYGKEIRQQLFLQALVSTNFVHTKARSLVNISEKVLNQWMTESPDFSELVDNIQKIKGDFFEDSLLGLVDSGDVASTIFANKTYNSDRGYGPKTQVDISHSGKISLEASLLDLNDLELTDDVKLAILEAVRKRDDRLRLSKENSMNRPLEFKVIEQVMSEDIKRIGLGDSS